MRHFIFIPLEWMVTVVLGNFRLSFTATDCISQGPLAENRIHSSWFKQREIYYRVLNGVWNLLERWRKELQVEFLGVTCRASLQSRPPGEHLPFVQSWDCPPNRECFRTMLPLHGRRKTRHFDLPQEDQPIPRMMLAGRNSKDTAPTFQILAFQNFASHISLSFIWLTAPRPHSCKGFWEM